METFKPENYVLPVIFNKSIKYLQTNKSAYLETGHTCPNSPNASKHF